MAKYETARSAETNTHTTHNDFGVSDSKGRKLGAYVTSFEVSFRELTDKEKIGDHGYYVIAPGYYFAWRPQATRNGESFGAYQSTRYCATAEERSAAVEKYLRDAETRARKNSAK